MSPLRLAFKSLSGHAFRSLGVFLSAVLVSGFALGSSLVLRGAEDSLRLAIERLGADIVVVPEGAAGTVESVMLMGKAVGGWMRPESVSQVAGIAGVAAASPQRYLATLPGTACCGIDEVALVAYDPGSDFTLRPWMEGSTPIRLGPGEAIAGTGVAVGKTEIEIAGRPCRSSLAWPQPGAHWTAACL